MNQDTELPPTRAERDLEAARRASDHARSIWWEDQKPTHCLSCSAELPEDHHRGDALPCGH